MYLREHFSQLKSQDEITMELRRLDNSMRQIHGMGKFVAGDMANSDIRIDDNTGLIVFPEYQLSSLIDRNKDIIMKFNIYEMCAVGIMAYNHFPLYYLKDDSIKYIRSNIDNFLRGDNIPIDIQDYYVDIFINDKIIYLEDYLKSKYGGNSNKNSKSKVYVKSNAAGRSFALNEENDSAYVNILLIPAIICLIVLIILVVYFIFIRR